MGETDLISILNKPGVAPWRATLARRVESHAVQTAIIAVILLNAAILAMETDAGLMASHGWWLKLADKACLVVFLIEIGCKLAVYRLGFWRSGWNVFDFLVVGVALVPGAGPWAVLRSLRVLRVLRLLTVVPSLRKVVAAFIHSIPGLGGVALVMIIFLFTTAVLATNLFGKQYPEWFGSLGASLFSLFQILTLEGWADMVRAIMETHPWAPLFFIPFIMLATFTILNLFIGIIVSTMQELSTLPEPGMPRSEMAETLSRIEADIISLRTQIQADQVLRKP